MAKLEQLPNVGRSSGYKATLGSNRIWYRLRDEEGTLINPLRYSHEWLMELAQSGQLFNIRVEYDLEPLKEFIRYNGVPDRFTGYATTVPLTDDLREFAHEDEIKKGEFAVFVLTDGYRRSLSVFALMEEGLPFQDAEIPIDQEAVKADEEYLATMLRKGSGKPLTPLEKAEGVRMLKQVYGWSDQKIAQTLPGANGELGVSTAYVSKLNTLAQVTTNTKKLIEQDVIAASNVVTLMRENGNDASKVERIINKTIEEVKTNGDTEQPVKITSKTIKKEKTPLTDAEREEILEHLKTAPWYALDDEKLKKIYALVK